ncbi:uncharacterized protein LOC101478408 isoform X1 [Maylandia zebra]|uniref:uncharacterized protein LOC101478408 isoform X1 n=1 Tax=Maylandia zebra TaxID=106582 RepID=UPI000329B5CD|nr:uncharacterized protein LOC101478408 isoform X1 [Maylandia zebra]
MEMSLKQLILMLLTVAATAMVISGQTAVFLNETRTVRVPSGSDLALYCFLDTEKYERYRIFWYSNKSEKSESSSNESICHKIINKPANKTENEDSKCILSNVNTNHSGWYFCKVTTEIPSLTEIRSSGTEVNVSDSEVTTYPSNVTNIKGQTFPPADPPALSDNWWIWVVLGASSFILFILTVTCVLLSRRQENREEPIYANTPNKQPSPRPSMSAAAVSLKAASSFQDPRTPSPASRYDEGKRRYRH